MGLLFFYLFLALIVSFLCSIMESVLLSTPQSFVVVEKEKGKGWARRLADYKQNVNKPLSAILSLNTVAHTIGAAGVGAQAVRVFGETYFGIVSAILTLMILVFTEIIPKTIGANNWRRLTPFTSHTIRVMVIIAYPLVWLTSLISKLISRNRGELSTSREEISALAGIGADEGIFTEKESKIIQNVLRLKDIRVSEIITPRVVVARADENTLLIDFLGDKEYLKFSRIPVYESNDEQITGYVFRQSVFEKLAEDHMRMKLKDLKREIVVVTDSMMLFRVWEILLEKKEHLALVVDEYGGMDGIVTMEDIIESLLGLEILDEKDTVTDMQQLARERWKSRQNKYNWLNKSD
ncbi:MAG: HlyC/CorC family transporter [Bacteroidetes bacterium]|nr:HlyC/CorC family transporter [Bacteroidota bacterium]